MASLVLTSALARGQSATIEGTVLDSKSQPAVGVTVMMKRAGGNTQTVTTNEHGRYQFVGVIPGEYELSAQGQGDGTVHISISRSDSLKQVELGPGAGKSPLPEFSDDPQFTVAGVTDASSSGSHGSSAAAPSAEALARETVSLGKNPEQAGSVDEKTTIEAADRQPDSFDLNERAGMALARKAPQDALPFLQRAAKAAVSDKQQAEVHRELGSVLERLNKPLDAVLEYQRAAELDPSEGDLFDWGSELLLHRAIAPAIEVFSRGHRLHPSSSRTLLGLAAALYSQASYESAVQRVCEASDIDPKNPDPYLFMGKMISTQAITSDAVLERLARFTRLQPENAQANYFYALGLWQQQGKKEPERAKALLKNAIRLDPTYGAAYLQLGIVLSDEGKLPEAIVQLNKAAELMPQSPEAHYRLSLAYKRTGEAARATQELSAYKLALSEVTKRQDEERRAVQQFVFTLQDHPK